MQSMLASTPWRQFNPPSLMNAQKGVFGVTRGIWDVVRLRRDTGQDDSGLSAILRHSALLAMRDLDRLSRTTSTESLALGFFGLLCVMAVGFVSALGPPVSSSVDYGYDERLGVQTLSPSDEDLASNCSDKGAAMVGAAATDSLDELRADAIAARGGLQSTAKLQTGAIGGHRVDLPCGDEAGARARRRRT